MEYQSLLTGIVAIVGLGGIVTTLGSWILIIKFFKDSRKELSDRAVQEGLKMGESIKLRSDVDDAHQKIRDIYSRLEKNQDHITEMRSDIKHILNAVDGITKRMDTAIKEK
jgi:uncharacterized coiled-coil DUF342 family protein